MSPAFAQSPLFAGRVACRVSLVACLAATGCGYSTRSSLPSGLRTVYVKPFVNKIDITQISTGNERFPIYRPQMEIDITKAVIERFQVTGLLRPATSEHADSRIEGDLVAFRRDALSYSASGNVDEWRLNIVVDLRYMDQKSGQLIWDESRFTGDTTYFTSGSRVETEETALTRAITDLARRIVERTVENW